MADVLKKFGKYFLLDILAQGGMAEINRARLGTPDGGARLVALKRILASYTSNAEFVSMFKSEIKTTSGFTHPNIVQLYDFGEISGQLYIAMELVDGKNLRQLMTRAAEKTGGVPVDIAMGLIEQAAAGLGYAHSFKDRFTGKSLNIVHRDISPQNLLVSYDGAVKVIDFGIAKAVTNSESTRAGVIKGKPSYLSPEQIAGDDLDGRSDVFALGIVLWEVLAGRKLFAGDNDYAVIRLIENCENTVKPPSVYNPKVPKELDKVVIESLKRDRNQRYRTCEDFQRELHKCLYKCFPDFNPADMGAFVREMFKNEIVEDRQKLQRLNEKAEQLLATMPEESAHTQVGAQTATIPLAARAQSKVVELDKKEKTASVALDFEASKVIPTKGLSKAAPAGGNPNPYASIGAIKEPSRPGFKAPQPEKKGGGFAAAAAVVLALGGGGYWWFTQQQQQTETVAKNPDALGTLVVEGNVQAATISVNGLVKGEILPLTIPNVRVSEPLLVKVTSNGYNPMEQRLTLNPGESRTLRFDLTREGAGTMAQAGGKTIPLRLNVQPMAVGAQTTVKINGQVVDSLAPVGTAPIGSAFEVEVLRDGFKPWRKSVTLSESQVGSSSDYAMDVNLVATKFGYVSVTSSPSPEEVVFNSEDGEERVNGPVSRKRMAIGTYNVKLVNRTLGREKTVQIKVEDEKVSVISDPLSNAERLPGSSN